MDRPPPHAARQNAQFVLLAALPAWILAAVQAAWAWPFFSDDSFISLRYAARLLAGEGLTWTAGERVEGYSNLLWVLTTAGLGALGLDLVSAARLLGAACTAVALWLLARAARPVDGRTTLLAALAPLLVASTSPIMAWTLAGLEGPMVLLWLAWGGSGVLSWCRTERARDGAVLRLGLPFALLCLTRPDGPLWAAVTGVGLALAVGSRGPAVALRTALSFATLPAAAFLGQLACRFAYYADLVPNTAHVKVEFGALAFAAGIAYVGDSLWVAIGLVGTAALSLLVLLRRAASRGPALCFLLPILAWFGYLTAVGGDHFPGYRLLQPALAPLALLVAAAATGWAAAGPRTTLAVLLALVGTVGNLVQSRVAPMSAFVRTETWEWRGKAIGEVLRTAFAATQPCLAVDAAGALPYYAQLPAIDLLGLCDRTIATTPPPPFLAALGAANGRELLQGHMRGNGPYVMDRAPDLMLFGQPPGLPLGVFVSALEFEADPRFLDGYRCVVLETGERELRPGLRENVRSPLWVRVAGRAGVQSDYDHIAVPAYLLGAYRQPRAFRFSYAPPAPDAPEFADWKRDLDATFRWFTADCHVVAMPGEGGSLQLELRAARPARLELAIPAGAWRVEAQPPSPAIRITIEGAVEQDGVFTVAPSGGSTALVATPHPNAKLPLRLDSLSLTRVR